MFAFSNGAADAVDTLLETAGIRGFFDDVVSCDEVKSFKPNPGVLRISSGARRRRAQAPGWCPAIRSTIGAMSARQGRLGAALSASGVRSVGIAPSVTVVD